MTDASLATVRLCDEGAPLEATFVPDAGMICSSLRHRGDELLAQNAGVAAYAQRGPTMGIPLLYPWANRLADFDYSVAGRTVVVPHDPKLIALDDNRLPIHGVIAGRLAWELVRTPGPGAQSLAASLSWSDSEPELSGEELSARRFELAGHEFDDGFDGVAAPARFSAAAGRQIELEFLEGYACAQVFAPRGRQFIWFEPMTAPANALRSGMGLRVLGPGERYRAEFVVGVQDLPFQGPQR
jgi:galactose mutarotase-like enzyme